MSPALHFKGDTAKRPVIHLETIKWILSEGKLGCCIWPSTNAFPTISSVLETGLAVIPDHTDAEICYLNISVEVDQNIFWFNITVDNSYAVKSCDTNGLKMSFIKMSLR